MLVVRKDSPQQSDPYCFVYWIPLEYGSVAYYATSSEVQVIGYTCRMHFNVAPKCCTFD